MSGFEVVGVLLGTVPLLISALEQYKTTKSRLRDFRYKALKIDQLIAALEEQRILIESDLRLLLRAVGFEDEYLQALGNNTSWTFLRSQDVSQDVRRYLGQSHEPYQRCLGSCQKCLEDIAKNIGGLTPGTKIGSGDLKELLIANSSDNGAFDFRKRIKFSLGREDLEQRIAALDKSTNMLRRLRLSGQTINDGAVQSTSRAVANFVSFLQKVRSHATLLYSAMSRGWVDGCHLEHDTKLYLDSRSAPLHRKKTLVTFKLMLASPPESSARDSLGFETEVHMLDDELQENTDLFSPEPIRQHHPETRKVTINLPHVNTINPLPIEVQNICSSMTQAQQANKALKLYLSNDRGLSSCLLPHQQPTTVTTAVKMQDVVTLDQILHDPPSPKYTPKKWNWNQRMALSFKLASSLLQLYSTPWLTVTWNKKTIYFARTNTPPNAALGSLFFDANHPFITHTFPGHGADCSVNQAHAKRPLLELGIILLEVWHEEPFESYATAKSLTLDDSYGRRYDVAREWLEDTATDVLPFYLDAVTRCIECSFSTTSSFPDWNDLTFRRSVCEGVVKPLWENCSFRAT